MYRSDAQRQQCRTFASLASLVAVLLHARLSYAQALSWREAIALAADRSPVIAIRQAEAHVADIDVAVAGRLANPRLLVGTTVDSALVYGTASMDLPVFGQRGLAIARARADAKTAAHITELSSLDAKATAAAAWIELWQAERETSVARATEARRARLLDVIDERVKVGSAPQLDLLRAETDAAWARAEAESAALRTAAAQAQLVLSIGADPSTLSIETKGDPPAGTSMSDELPVALSSHAALTLADAAKNGAAALVRLVRRQRWPLIGLQLGGSFLNRAPPPVNDLSVSLSFELPLFDGPVVNHAQSVYEAAVLERAVTERGLRIELRRTNALARASQRRSVILNAEVVPRSRAAYELALEAYQAGSLDLTALLASEQSYAEAQLAGTLAIAESARTAIALWRAQGTL